MALSMGRQLWGRLQPDCFLAAEHESGQTGDRQRGRNGHKALLPYRSWGSFFTLVCWPAATTPLVVGIGRLLRVPETHAAIIGTQSHDDEFGARRFGV